MSKTKNKTDNKTEKVIAAEKEQFSKQQRHNISKSVTSSETPLKEKYVRNIILGTYREAGATTFWSYTINLPLSSNALISWKFCNILHKVLRDGHSNAVRDSHRFCRNVKDMGTLWGNLHDRYGHIVALSAKFLCLKMEFHVKHKGIPGNLEVSDENLEREAGSEINKLFDMTQELLDYLDAGLKMAETVLRQLDANGAKSNTPAGQCRLAPLIPIILDCSFLYHFSVRLLFKLHSRVPPDSLLGHRERFRDLFNSLTQFFDRAREMEFFKLVIQVPDLPDSPPNFLRAAALGEYVKPVVVMPNQELPEEDEAEPQAEYSEASQIPQYYLPSQMGVPGLDPKETDLNTMRKELEVIKPELQLVKIEAQRCVTQLKSQVNSIEAELEEQRTHKQMALVDNEHLRMEVQALRSSNTANSGEQADRVQAAEVRFCQLKERHAELVTSHAELLKKNADTVRVLCNTQHSLDELLRSRQQMANDLELLRQENLLVGERQRLEIERVKRELQERTAELAHVHSALGNKETEGSQLSGALVGLQTEREVLLQSSREQEAELSSVRQQVKMQQCLHDQDIQRYNRELQTLRAQLQQQLAINAEQKLEIERLRRELDQRRAEVSQASSAMRNQELLSGTLAGLQAERDVMLQSAQEQEAELSSLRQQVQTQQSSLNQDRDRNSRELDNLKTQLQQQVCHAGELRQRLQEEQFCLLQCAVVEAEGIVLDAVAKLEDPLHVRCVSSPDYLVNRAEVTLSSLDKMQHSHMVYLNNMNDASGLLRAVTHFSHLAADTIVNGAATSHTALTDQADCLADSCRDCATHCLQFLKDLKLQATIQRADPAAIRNAFQRILTLGKELRPKAQDVLQEELGDMVDKEMMATSTAIEEAVLRMDEILNQARKDTSGIKLEVNQSIIGSCSDLMKAIHMLVTAATDLQKDIVEGGRGATSVKEFYAKNSRWTEGLISASKAVGWGATVMLDSADRVITDQGKYEELIVCSHEIAASTAQLVAASKVKADRNNKKLYTLQQASRHVNDMAAVVVTSTKHGQQQITEKVPMDFSGISRIKLKTEEMESQVKVLELENQLELQRVHLCELRRRHYELQGNGIDQEVEDQSGEESFPPPPPPILLPPSIQLSQAYSQTQPYLNTQSLQSPIPSINPFAQAQSSSLPQSYTPTLSSALSQLHTPTQSYTPTQSFTPYMASEDDSFFKVQSYSSQPFSHTPNFSQPQPFSQLQSLSQPQPVPKNTAEAKPATAKKHSIFQKSGTLLKNAFRRGEAGTGES